MTKERKSERRVAGVVYTSITRIQKLKGVVEGEE